MNRNGGDLITFVLVGAGAIFAFGVLGPVGLIILGAAMLLFKDD